MPVDIIAIAGASASGKTTVARILSRKIPNSMVVSMDWFYKSLPATASAIDYNFDHPDAIDWAQLIKLVKQVSAGKSVSMPDHDYITHAQIPAVHHVSGVNTLIIEGIFALCNPVLNDLYRYRVFVNCDIDKTLSRRVLRDINERGYTVPVVIHRFETFVKPAYESFIKPSEKHADVTIYNTSDRDLTKHRGIDMIVCAVIHGHDCPGA